MAELVPGAIGLVSGKVGTVIASKWRDIHYLKGILKANKKKKGDQDNINCIRFTKIYDFLSFIPDLVEDGFKHQNTGRASAFNLALSANIGAFLGDGAELDYASIRISTGSLIGAIAPEVTFEVPDCITVRWADLGDTFNQAPSDRAMILFYNSDGGGAAISEGVVRRGELQAEIPFPPAFHGKHVQGYIYFTNAAGTKNSQSTYLGCFIVPESDTDEPNPDK
ncbi:DUF6266 family protein [Arcticibacter tournemirensis]